MRKPLMIGTALLLALGVIGAGVVASESHVLRRHEHESAGRSDLESRPMRLAERGERERHAEGHDGGSRRREHDAGRPQRRSTPLSEAGPSDPNASPPDNGLFNKGARPKVEVQ